MDSLFYSQSQSASGNNWTYGSLNNFRPTSPVVQSNLKQPDRGLKRKKTEFDPIMGASLHPVSSMPFHAPPGPPQLPSVASALPAAAALSTLLASYGPSSALTASSTEVSVWDGLALKARHEAAITATCRWCLLLFIVSPRLRCSADRYCCAGSRTFVHERVYDDFLEKAKARAQSRSVGELLQKGIEQGPQVKL